MHRVFGGEHRVGTRPAAGGSTEDVMLDREKNPGASGSTNPENEGEGSRSGAEKYDRERAKRPGQRDGLSPAATELVAVSPRGEFGTKG